MIAQFIYNLDMNPLIESLVKTKVLRSPSLIDAFLACDRKDFVREELIQSAYVDAPLPTCEGQTISQPYTVAFMLELLDVRPGQKVLDVGFGSGWTTAILAHVVGSHGRVYGLEVNPEVFAFGKKNLGKFVFPNVELYNKSGWAGLPDEAPFDRILVSAAAPQLPPVLGRELGEGGRLVIPIGVDFACSVCLFGKGRHGLRILEKHEGFAFVPLIKK